MPDYNYSIFKQPGETFSFPERAKFKQMADPVMKKSPEIELEGEFTKDSYYLNECINSFRIDM